MRQCPTINEETDRENNRQRGERREDRGGHVNIRYIEIYGWMDACLTNSEAGDGNIEVITDRKFQEEDA